jgi:hypothetical protein
MGEVNSLEMLISTCQSAGYPKPEDHYIAAGFTYLFKGIIYIVLIATLQGSGRCSGRD